jgi:N-acetylglucosamine kinase-like BadF-type ATPase
MSVFVGLDCGGSSSRVLALDDEGNVLFQGQSGAANLASTPEGRLRRNLQNAVRGCPKPDYVCGCFAGLINQTARDRGLSILRDTFEVEAQYRAEPDYTAALYAATDADICVISGTGSLVCSRVSGKIVKSGGRGYILGDEGSGYHFGRDAVLRYLQEPETASDHLKKNVEDVFGSLDESVIITGVYKAPTPATILGRLAKCIGSDADAGEEYALQSLEMNLKKLVLTVKSHIEKHHSAQDTLNLTLSGGVWKASHMFRDRFIELLNEVAPAKEFHVHRLTKPPLYGAVFLAKEMK